MRCYIDNRQGKETREIDVNCLGKGTMKGRDAQRLKESKDASRAKGD